MSAEEWQNLRERSQRKEKSPLEEWRNIFSDIIKGSLRRGNSSGSFSGLDPAPYYGDTNSILVKSEIDFQTSKFITFNQSPLSSPTATALNSRNLTRRSSLGPLGFK